MGDNIYIDKNAVGEEGVTVFPNNYIGAGSVIKAGAVLRPNNIIEGSIIEGGAVVTASVLEGAFVGAGAQVGPFCYMRKGAKVGAGCKAGDFVEIKNSSLGNGSKAAHHAYIGDAEIGMGVNIGCGVVFANYDGKVKARTTVGDHCFIGCNCNIVAPVHIGGGAYIAAGTTVTQNVAERELCIGRARQSAIKDGAEGRYKNG